jgi:hypothetical protein
METLIFNIHKHQHEGGDPESVPVSTPKKVSKPKKENKSDEE